VTVVPASVTVVPASVTVVPASVTVVPASVTVVPAKAGTQFGHYTSIAITCSPTRTLPMRTLS
jgi:hypothetical protein